jgi:hypothetical protein
MSPRAGFRIVIRQTGTSPHQCGGDVVGVRAAPKCPNCGQLIFPVFRIDNQDPSVAALELWDLPLLQVLVCPSCALYMEPYWVRFDDDAITIEGGERDGGDVLQKIESPYEVRPIELESLDTGIITDSTRLRLLSREIPPGIYHQLGGEPFRGSLQPLSCYRCSNVMIFAGIVDYDDANVPLYEPVRRPVALIIGDGDCLHFFTCRSCAVVGLRWQH